MNGFYTKEVNNNGDYEITFYTENREDFKKVQSLCRELIGHGKPVSNEGDLISRSEAEKLGATCLAKRNENGQLEAIISLDNAPTVAVNCKDCDGYEAGYSAGLKDAERPQGEWYYGEDECGQDGWFCSECGFFVPWYYTYYKNDIDFIREYKACPHCLAEMVTYTGKDRDTKGGAEK